MSTAIRKRLVMSITFSGLIIGLSYVAVHLLKERILPTVYSYNSLYKIPPDFQIGVAAIAVVWIIFKNRRKVKTRFFPGSPHDLYKPRMIYFILVVFLFMFSAMISSMWIAGVVAYLLANIF
jgi:hypothetical protein